MNDQLNPVSVVIVVYNEAETIEEEIRRLHEIIVSRIPGSEFIVAEDGSTDGTKEIINRLIGELGIIHSTSGERIGYAKALKNAVAMSRCSYVFFSDSGSKHNHKEFWDLYDLRKYYDMISGERISRAKIRFRNIIRFCITSTFNRMVSYYFRINIIDSDCGYRIYNRKVVEKVFNEEWINKDCVNYEIFLRSIFSGFSFKEVPVSYKVRKGKSRGMPYKKIPRVIFRILCNKSKLRRILFDKHYSFSK